jgi:hypothetical protein
MRLLTMKMASASEISVHLNHLMRLPATLKQNTKLGPKMNLTFKFSSGEVFSF